MGDGHTVQYGGGVEEGVKEIGEEGEEEVEEEGGGGGGGRKCERR